MGLPSPPPPPRAREFLIHVFLVMYFLCWLLSVCLQFYIKFLGNKTLHKESSNTLNWNLIASNKDMELICSYCRMGNEIQLCKGGPGGLDSCAVEAPCRGGDWFVSLTLSPYFFLYLGLLACRLACPVTHLLSSQPGGGGTWVFFGWVCAPRDSKLAPRSKKNFP